ncbi:High mobility group B protein 2 [Zea mays]|uniref:High mobility group B protein 2 n=1 Tax=Zea mays TaxID=4577 RepID=A0A1D6EUL6_MAIZE|nr:High mobility group B protein 2 [Zea mays]
MKSRARSSGGDSREEFRKDYKEKHPNVKQVSVIGKAGGDMWKSLSDAEKAPYVSKAEKLKVEYTKKMDAYNNKQSGGPTESGDSDKSKSEVNDGDEEVKANPPVPCPTLVFHCWFYFVDPKPYWSRPFEIGFAG